MRGLRARVEEDGQAGACDSLVVEVREGDGVLVRVRRRQVLDAARAAAAVRVVPHVDLLAVEGVRLVVGDAAKVRDAVLDGAALRLLAALVADHEVVAALLVVVQVEALVAARVREGVLDGVVGDGEHRVRHVRVVVLRDADDGGEARRGEVRGRWKEAVAVAAALASVRRARHARASLTLSERVIVAVNSCGLRKE